MQNFSSQGCQINKGSFSPRISEGLRILLIFLIECLCFKDGRAASLKVYCFFPRFIVIYVKEADV